MKQVLTAGAVAAGLTLTMVTAVNADRARHHDHYESHSEMYPSATPRQLKNLCGYENGGYYELDSNAVPFGSRVLTTLAQG
jgi:hypothetical protein